VFEDWFQICEEWTDKPTNQTKLKQITKQNKKKQNKTTKQLSSIMVSWYFGIRIGVTPKNPNPVQKWIPGIQKIRIAALCKTIN